MIRQHLISASRLDVEKAELRIHQANIRRARALGCAINGFEIVGKINGVDAPRSSKTLRWADIEEMKDGKFYIMEAKTHIADDIILDDIILERRYVLEDERKPTTRR